MRESGKNYTIENCHCLGPPGRLSAISVFLCKSILYGAFVWARRALNSRKRRFPARAGGDCTDSDDSSCPTTEWCPFNWYRSSGDINSGATSWLRNLQSTTRFQDYERPLSVPGCWAYPDMLEVGRVAAPTPSTFLSWNRAHFGAWCVVSAPLILGLDVTDTATLTPVLDIIGNKMALAVNQQWAGHPGMLVEDVVPLPQVALNVAVILTYPCIIH